MAHKNFKVLDQTVIDAMCARYRTGMSVTDLMSEFSLGRNKIIKTLKQHLGSEYEACACLARVKASQRAGHSRRGSKNPHTPEWNAKIAVARKGIGHSQETRALISQRMKERELDPEWQAKKAEVSAKIVATKRENGYFIEHSKRHSEWMKENAPMRGKKMSTETRAVMSARKKELVAQGWRPTPYEHTEEHRQACRESTLQMWRDGKFSYGDGAVARSKLEKRVFEQVKAAHPDAVHSHVINDGDRVFCYDIFIPSLNTLIEVNGDFWHCNSKLMTDEEWLQVRPNLSDIREKDERKARVAVQHGLHLIVLWESDLSNLSQTKLRSLVVAQNTPISSI